VTASHKPLLATLLGQPTTKVPFWLMRQAGRYLPEYRALRAKAGSFLDLCLNPEFAAEVTVQPIRRYGMDGAILFSDILIVPFGLGQKLEFKEGEGPKLNPITSASTLSMTGFHDRVEAVYETVKRVRPMLPGEVTFLGFAGSPWTVASYMIEGGSSRDFEIVKRFALSQPDAFQGIIDLVVEATVEYLVAQADAGVDAVQLFDSWCGVLDESEFDRWVIAPNQAIVSKFKARRPNIPVIAFPRGAALNYARFAATVGADAIGLDTTVPMSAAQLLQKTLPVQGNLDPITLLVGGDALDRAVMRILNALGPGPFIFNLGHGVVPPTPPEHVARVTELIRAYGKPAGAA
jgi:uroporphyrinogen decarboxylase